VSKTLPACGTPGYSANALRDAGLRASAQRRARGAHLPFSYTYYPPTSPSPPTPVPPYTHPTLHCMHPTPASLRQTRRKDANLSREDVSNHYCTRRGRSGLSSRILACAAGRTQRHWRHPALLAICGAWTKAAKRSAPAADYPACAGDITFSGQRGGRHMLRQLGGRGGRTLRSGSRGASVALSNVQRACHPRHLHPLALTRQPAVTPPLLYASKAAL